MTVTFLCSWLCINPCSQTRIQQRRLRPGAEFCHDEVSKGKKTRKEGFWRCSKKCFLNIYRIKLICTQRDCTIYNVHGHHMWPQADDTLLTEQRNLLDLINKLEGGLGQVGCKSTSPFFNITIITNKLMRVGGEGIIQDLDRVPIWLWKCSRSKWVGEPDYTGCNNQRKWTGDSRVFQILLFSRPSNALGPCKRPWLSLKKRLPRRQTLSILTR